MRTAKSKRKSRETDINLELKIEGKGKSKIVTPIIFLSHMLENFSKHGLFDIKLSVKGDIEVDQHHTIEDIGIALGKAFRETIGNLKGINRSGFFAFPMDEALGIVAVDISGRPKNVFKAKFKRRFCGELDTDLVEDFFEGFSMGLGCNIAVYVPYGRNDHHKIEAIFKAFGKAMQIACSINKRIAKEIPSTKNLIDMMK